MAERIKVTSGTKEINNETITVAAGTENGGAVYVGASGTVQGGASVVFEDNAINTSGVAQGGAIYNAGKVTLDGGSDGDLKLEFVSNSAVGDQTGAQGGAIYNAAGATASVTDVSFEDNSATSDNNAG